MNTLRGVLAALLLRSLGAVLSHLAVAIGMLVLWIDPMAFGPDTAGNLELLMALEFVVLHSTAFMVAFRFMKGFPRWVFSVLYAPFGLMIGFAASSWVLILLFAWHLGSGIWGDFDMAERHVGGFLVRYVPVFLWFVLLPFVVAVLPLPGLGWNEYPSLAKDVMGTSKPAFVPAWAMFYFGGRAVWELLVHQWEQSGALHRFIDRARQT